MSKCNQWSKNVSRTDTHDIQKDNDWNFYYTISDPDEKPRKFQIAKIMMSDEDGNFTHKSVFSHEENPKTIKATSENTILYIPNFVSKGVLELKKKKDSDELEIN